MVIEVLNGVAVPLLANFIIVPVLPATKTSPFVSTINGLASVNELVSKTGVLENGVLSSSLAIYLTELSPFDVYTTSNNPSLVTSAKRSIKILLPIDDVVIALLLVNGVLLLPVFKKV